MHNQDNKIFQSSRWDAVTNEFRQVFSASTTGVMASIHPALQVHRGCPFNSFLEFWNIFAATKITCFHAGVHLAKLTVQEFLYFQYLFLHPLPSTKSNFISLFKTNLMADP